MIDPRLGNLSFTGCGIGRDHQLARGYAPVGGNVRGYAPAGYKPCGCCGAKVVAADRQVCPTCRREGNEEWRPARWRDKVAAAIAAESQLEGED